MLFLLSKFSNKQVFRFDGISLVVLRTSVSDSARYLSKPFCLYIFTLAFPTYKSRALIQLFQDTEILVNPSNIIQ